MCTRIRFNYCHQLSSIVHFHANRLGRQWSPRAATCGSAPRATILLVAHHLVDETRRWIRIDVLELEAVPGGIGAVVVHFNVALFVRQQVAVATSVALLPGSPREHSAAQVAGARAGHVTGDELVLVEDVQLGASPAPLPLVRRIIRDRIVPRPALLPAAPCAAALSQDGLHHLDDQLALWVGECEGTGRVREAALVDDYRRHLVRVARGRHRLGPSAVPATVHHLDRTREARRGARARADRQVVQIAAHD